MNVVLLLLPALAAGMLAHIVARHVAGTAIGIAERRGIVDHPGERSSHSAPTPRVGGIGLVAGVLVALAIYLPFAGRVQAMQQFLEIDPVQWRAFAGFFAMALAAFALGLFDDIKGMPPLAKLAAQAAIGCIPAASGLVVKQLQIPYLPVIDLPFAAGAALAWVWVVLAMNAVNFMDGINGLAGRFAEVAGIVLVVIGLNRGWCSEIGILGAALWGAGTGFLFWNRPVAKTFLGDCGSQALGAMVAAAALLVHANDVHRVAPDGRAILDPVIGVGIVAWPFVFDVLYTLARRARKGASLLQAHREHLYQRHLLATGGDHEQTLQFVMDHVYAAAIVAVLYVRVSSPYAPGFRALLLCAALAVAVHYAWRVVRIEEAGRTA